VARGKMDSPTAEPEQNEPQELTAFEKKVNVIQVHRTLRSRAVIYRNVVTLE
jgi:hypothetical protein